MVAEGRVVFVRNWGGWSQRCHGRCCGSGGRDVGGRRQVDHARKAGLRARLHPRRVEKASSRPTSSDGCAVPTGGSPGLAVTHERRRRRGRGRSWRPRWWRRRRVRRWRVRGELRLWPGVWMESPAAAAADCAEYEASEAEGSIGAACGLRPLAMAKAFDGGGLAGGGGGGGGVVWRCRHRATRRCLEGTPASPDSLLIQAAGAFRALQAHRHADSRKRRGRERRRDSRRRVNTIIVNSLMHRSRGMSRRQSRCEQPEEWPASLAWLTRLSS